MMTGYCIKRLWFPASLIRAFNVEQLKLNLYIYRCEYVLNAYNVLMLNPVLFSLSRSAAPVPSCARFRCRSAAGARGRPSMPWWPAAFFRSFKGCKRGGSDFTSDLQLSFGWPLILQIINFFCKVEIKRLVRTEIWLAEPRSCGRITNHWIVCTCAWL